MSCDRDIHSGDKLSKSAAVVGVGVGNNDRVQLIQGETQVLEAAGDWEKASLQSSIDQEGPSILNQDGDPGSYYSKLEDTVGDLYGLAEDHVLDLGERVCGTLST